MMYCTAKDKDRLECGWLLMYYIISLSQVRGRLQKAFQPRTLHRACRLDQVQVKLSQALAYHGLRIGGNASQPVWTIMGIFRSIIGDCVLGFRHI